MYKINNTMIQLDKSDKIDLLKKILKLKKNTALTYNKDNDDYEEESFDKQYDEIMEEPIVEPIELSLEDTENKYLSDKDKILIQLFLNANNINKINSWDVMSKKYKLLYNLLKNDDDENS